MASPYESDSNKGVLAANLINLTTDSQRLVRLTALSFLVFELFLIAMHFAVTGFLGDIAGRTADGHIGGFDLNDEATLAVWFSSFQLLLIAVFCQLNSWVDQTRTWPLHSRQFWRFGFFLFMLMSIDETAGLHEIFGKAMVIVLPDLPISASMWWTIPYAILVALFLMFLARRLLKYVDLLFVLTLFVIAWFVANALEHIHHFSMVINFAIEEGLEMAGATAMLFVVSSIFVMQAKQLIHKS
jgi:hypothetical protein